MAAWDADVQRTAMGRVAELFANISDPRLNDSHYDRIALELEQNPAPEQEDGNGDEWSLAELADGRSEEDVLAAVSAQ